MYSKVEKIEDATHWVAKATKPESNIKEVFRNWRNEFE